MTKNRNCSGCHYIRNRKTTEQCPNRDKCFRYDSNTEGNRFKHVADFRECKEYLKTKQERIPAQVQKQITAYENAVKKDVNLISYCTFATLYEIEVFKHYADQIIEALQLDGLYRQRVKQLANQFVSSMNRFLKPIYETCYDNDQDCIRHYLSEIDTDLLKLKMSVIRLLDANRVPNSMAIGHLFVCANIIQIIVSNTNQRAQRLKELDKDLSLAGFMDISVLSQPLRVLILEAVKKYVQLEIDFKNDMNVSNGVKIIRNKLSDKGIIRDMFVDCMLHRKERKDSKEE